MARTNTVCAIGARLVVGAPPSRDALRRLLRRLATPRAMPMLSKGPRDVVTGLRSDHRMSSPLNSTPCIRYRMTFPGRSQPAQAIRERLEDERSQPAAWSPWRIIGKVKL